jgi:hypothetical protein
LRWYGDDELLPLYYIGTSDGINMQREAFKWKEEQQKASEAVKKEMG